MANESASRVTRAALIAGVFGDSSSAMASKWDVEQVSEAFVAHR
jgi:hypothetical protein